MKKRILIADGNVQTDRDTFTLYNGCAPSGMFDQLLRRGWSDIETEIAFPADAGVSGRLPLDAYDGILITGSNSNIYKKEPGTLRQIDFARAAFASGTPVLGVCWGLQLATVALGGEVAPSRAENCKCEAPFASGIRLVGEGRDHPMHAGRPATFDAFAFHSDEVIRLPKNSTVTAVSENFIQAAEIQAGNSVFWGVQYHPELSGAGMAGFLRGSVNELVIGGRYKDAGAVEAAALAVEAFAPGAPITDDDRHHFESIEVDQFEFRPLEIANWVDRLVMRSEQ
jgi:GMP synthase (glutamine-hydrolysing)